MNLFLLAWRSDGAVDATAQRSTLAAVAGSVPHLRDARVTGWSAADGGCAAAFAAHTGPDVGGVSYHAADDGGMAFFAGRPILWRGGEADGRAVLDPGFYRAPAARWARDLDGRFFAARYDERERVLEYVTDPLGAYPVYTGRRDGVTYLGNAAEAVRAAIGAETLDPPALATFVGCGWSLGGRPLWAGVHREPRALLRRIGRDGDAAETTLPLAEIAAAFRAGHDPARAAEVLTQGVRALADWPGRPQHLPLTGGRDSRVVLAAALRGEVDFEARTSALPELAGFPETGDVRIARLLAESVGRRHVVVLPPEGVDAAAAFGALRAASPGFFSLSSIAAAELPGWAGAVDAADRPLPVLHSGAGGEIARLYYGRGTPGASPDALARSLTRKLLKRYPAPLLSRAGAACVRAHVGEWTRETTEGGVAPEDVPDALYLLERMSNWAGPLHAMSEHFRDVASPLWMARMLPELLGAAPGDRASGAVHQRLIDALAPDLAAQPYEGATYGSGRAAQLAKLRRQVVKELRRRAAVRAGEPAVEGDPLIAAVGRTRDAAEAAPQHPAWEVLDRSRVRRVLRADPRRLSARDREHVWRLAAIFLR